MKRLMVLACLLTFGLASDGLAQMLVGGSVSFVGKNHTDGDDSELEKGPMFQGLVGKALGGVDAFLQGGYTRRSWGGGSGYDAVINVGVAARKTLGGPFVGAEANYVSETSKSDEGFFDDLGGDPKASGFSLLGLGGYGFGAGGAVINIIGGVGIHSTGDAKVDGDVIWEGGSYFTFKVGAEVLFALGS